MKHPRYTPPDQIALNLILLKNSPPSGFELRNSNVALNAVFTQLDDILAAVKRYIDRISRIYEIRNTKYKNNIII